MPPKSLPARRRNDVPTAERRAGRQEPLDQGGLDQLIGYHLRLAQISVFRDFAEATREFDMSPGWVGLLVLIKHNPGLTQSRLAQAIGIDRSTLVNSLDRLEARRLVERSASPLDRRANVLQLTAAGEKLLGDILPLIRAHETRLKSHLGEEDAPRLLEMLDRLAGFRQPPVPDSAPGEDAGG
jgi:DNA-binding MarR family transcriptional regulator